MTARACRPSKGWPSECPHPTRPPGETSPLKLPLIQVLRIAEPMAFRATPGRTPPGPAPGMPSASFPSPQAPMPGPGGLEEEEEDEEPAEVSEERAGRTGQ